MYLFILIFLYRTHFHIKKNVGVWALFLFVFYKTFSSLYNNEIAEKVNLTLFDRSYYPLKFY